MSSVCEGIFYYTLKEERLFRMKNIFKVVLFALVLTVLAACGNTETNKNVASEEEQQTQNETQVFPVTVTDAVGTDVTIEKAPNRIVSLIPSNTEILFELGMGDQVVGVNDNDNYPKEVESIEKIGGMEYNIEMIISLQPDLVVAHESGLYGLGDGIAQLEAAGISVFVVKNAVTFEETYETILQIGQLTGTTQQAKKVNEHIQTKLQEITDKVKQVEPKTAFVVVGVEPDIYAVGSGTFLDEMLKVANIKNAVTEADWPMYSAEQFVASNADYVIATYASDLDALKGNELFKTMKAVQANQLVTVDGDLTSRQAPRLAEGVEQLAKAVYPELFE